MDEIKEMLEMGIIRKLASPYASPVVIVKKKSGSNHICVDNQKLNKLTISDSDPMKTSEDLFSSWKSHNFSWKLMFAKVTGGYPWQKKMCSRPRLWHWTGHTNFSKWLWALKTLVRHLFKKWEKCFQVCLALRAISTTWLRFPAIRRRICKLWKSFWGDFVRLVSLLGSRSRFCGIDS